MKTTEGLSLAAIAGAVVLVGGGAIALSSAAQAVPAGAQAVTVNPDKLSALFGVQFRPEPSAAGGARPQLPGGGSGVPASAAVRAAAVGSPAVGIATDFGRIRPDVTVEAEYGLVTMSHEGKRLASGSIQPDIQGRPVWVVTFSGPGVVLTSSGPHPELSPIHHELDVVIDAATGQYLRAYSYQ